MSMDFDAIVVGSGITGGWAAKELTERGLKVLMIERGPMIEHGSGYTTETLAPWEMPFRGLGNPELVKQDYPVQSRSVAFDEFTRSHFVNDRENPYQSSTPFNWIRGYQVGGRSLIWGRQCYRWSDLDFGANKADGHGEDWPIRYADLAPWYDHVERFIGVSGSIENLPQLPDGRFQPPMQMNAVEQQLARAVAARYAGRRVIIGRTANLTEDLPGRSKCQYRGICGRGCSFGAYFSTQSSTLPAAQATGRLTILPDSLVASLNYDPVARKVTGAQIIDTATRQKRTVTARIIFLCAGSINSLSILLRSRSESMPNGLANSSGRLGRYFMDHGLAMSAIVEVPGFEDHNYFGNRPNGIFIPRYINVTEPEPALLRGYSFQGFAYRAQWTRAYRTPGIGAEFKARFRASGSWHMLLAAFAEGLPMADNRVTLDPVATDAYGLPQTRIEHSYAPNDRALLRHAEEEAVRMASLIGGKVIVRSADPGPGGTAIHEMGGAAMGHDPARSVLNAGNQAHDVQNLFVTDGAAMASTACQNPSLTYMALTARACDAAVSKMQAGLL